MKFIPLFLVLFSFEAKSQDLSEMMKSLDVDKASITKMIDMLEQSGKIPKKDADKARADLAKMTDADFKAVKDKVKGGVKAKEANPGTATTTTESAEVQMKLLDEGAK